MNERDIAEQAYKNGFEKGYANGYADGEAKLKHGKWGPVRGFLGFYTWDVQCSLCGTPQDYKSNYCPECGAKMCGDKNG